MAAIGMIELNSVAIGFEVADIMVKTGTVELVLATPVCPGKFVVLIKGTVANVKSSIEAGRASAKTAFVDSFIIPNVHHQIFPAITGTTQIEKLEAIGVIETFSLSSCLVIADSAVKTANIKLLEIRLGKALGGKSFVIFTGKVSAVKSAIEGGIEQVKDKNIILNYVVIPSPHPDLINHFL
jgi:microcompartment protein CcmL/EutN